MKVLVTTVVLACLTCIFGNEISFYDYIIVGAGPAGLQMAYFLQTAGRNYVVLERANISGSFFSVYPRHDKLISINKRHTGHINREFNLRHDWNSLISEDKDLLMKHYSQEMFPLRTALLEYLKDFQEKHQLNVQFNTDVRDIAENTKQAGEYKVSLGDQNGNTYKCKTLIIATGLWKPVTPDFPGSELTVGYEDMTLDPHFYEGKSVLIMGRGNTGFEVAESIYGNTNFIHMIGKSRIRLSWQTHYVGDIRAVSNELLDTYQLKSLDGQLEGDVEQLYVKRVSDDKLRVTFSHDEDAQYDNNPTRVDYDVVIRCLGWTFDKSIFHNDTVLFWNDAQGRKYPFILNNYRGASFKNIYFAGTLAHSLDYRKSAGGFIHGFRYTTQALHRILEQKLHGVEWKHTTAHTDQLVSTLVKRLNEASDIYQMFGVLGDVVLLHGNDLFSYYEAFPLKLMQRFSEYTGFQCSDDTQMIVVSMQYGKNFSGPGKDVFNANRATVEPSRAHTSNFLHPVLYYYKTPITALEMFRKRKGEILPTPDRIHHIVEDFLTEFSTPESHILPLRRFVEYVLGRDMRQHFAEDCLKLVLTHSAVPHSCLPYLHSQGVVVGEQLWRESRFLSLPF